ncbi:MAG: hypothetical protein A2977_02250 [Alphaproteobacteria bacterium RIFCSPLOWO2_01_FULL_45_8]|nr:MAG: hypothetical protein A2977_02250 [Alphaproteobacteria bacterium RIFCSPLOWO2_01_FULL_45_8]
MKKIIFLIAGMFSFFSVETSFSATAGSVIEEADYVSKGHYFPRISEDTIGALSQTVYDLPESPAVKEFRENILPHLLLTRLEENESYPLFKKYLARETYVQIRTHYIETLDLETEEGKQQRSVLYTPCTVFSEFAGSVEDYIGYLLSSQALFKTEPATREAFLSSYRETLDKTTKRYNDALREVGPENNSLLRHFIDTQILFPAEGRTPETLAFWKTMKDSRLIDTIIPDDLAGWTYNARVATRQALSFLRHPHILTLGCGSTVWHQPDHDALSAFRETRLLPSAINNCLTCGDAHVGELTVALPIEGATKGYDPSSHAMVRADVLDPDFWAGLGGHQFHVIKEHTRTFDNNEIRLPEDRIRAFVDNVDTHLIPGGLVEILTEPRDPTETGFVGSAFYDKGYTLHEIVPMNENTAKLIFQKR